MPDSNSTRLQVFRLSAGTTVTSGAKETCTSDLIPGLAGILSVSCSVNSHESSAELSQAVTALFSSLNGVEVKDNLIGYNKEMYAIIKMRDRMIVKVRVWQVPSKGKERGFSEK